MSDLRLPMEVGEWVLKSYEWADSFNVAVCYERPAATSGKATIVIRCLPHQAPSVALELLAVDKVEGE